MRQVVIAAAIMVALGACSSETRDQGQESGARRALASGSQNQPALKSPMFDAMAKEMAKSAGLPTPPAELPPVIAAPAPAPQGRVPPWANDRLDATSFDTLYASQNATLAKMEPEAAEIYDQAVKYLLIQVAADPAVVQSASAGGSLSDAQLMQSVKRILHGKTPSQVVDEAQQLSDRISSEGG